MPTSKEIEDLLRANGVSVEDVAKDLDAEIAAGRMDNAGAMEALNDLYDYYASKGNPKNAEEQSGIVDATQQESAQNAPGPGYFQGITQQYAQSASANLASRLAGALNINAVRKVLLPATSLIARENPLITGKDVQELRNAKEQYAEGKKQYEQNLAKFESEHPSASKASEIAGDITALVVPFGKVGQSVKGASFVAKGVKALSKAGKVGEVAGKILPRVAGETAAFGTYGATKEGFAGDSFSPEAAAKGLYQYGGIGGLFGLFGGAAGEFEEPLVKMAERLGANPLSARLLGGTTTTAVEGVGIGAAPAIVQGRLPTVQEIKEGEQFAFGARTAALALAGAGRGTRYLAEKPSSQLQEMADNQEISKRVNKLIKGKRELESEFETEARNEKIEKINKELNPLLAELNKSFDVAQKDVLSLSDELGWKVADEKGIQIPKKDPASRYIYLQKDGKIMQVRLSGHKSVEPIREGQYDYDIRKTADENLQGLNKFLTDGKIPEGAVAVQQKEIDKFIKQNPGTTPEQAAYILKTGKAREFAREPKKAKRDATLFEKVLKPYQKTIEGIRGQFNTLRPISKAIETDEKVFGKSIDADKRADITLSKLQSGGEVEEFISPIKDLAEDLQKKDKAVLLKADEIAKAEKDLMFEKLKEEPSQEKISSLEAKLEDFKDSKYAHKLVKETRGLLQKGLDLLYESGRLTKEKYNELKKRQEYVPSRAVLEEEGLVANQMKGEVEQSLKAYGGDAAAYENSIVSSANLLKSEYRFAEIQKAKKQYISVAKEIREATPEPPIKNYSGETVKFNRKNQIVVWDKGTPQVWNVPTKVAEYFNPEPIPDRSKLAKVALAIPRGIMNFFKGGTTAASAGFAVSNLPRDYTSATIMSRNGAYIGPSEIREAGADLLTDAPIVKALKKEGGTQTAVTAYGLPNLAEDNVRDIIKMYEAPVSGAKNGTQLNVLARLFTTGVPMYAKKLGKIASSTNRTVLEGLSYAGNLSEETTRLAVFKSTLRRLAVNENQYMMWLKNPNSIPKKVMAEAGNEAREVTLNFKRQMAPWVEATNRYVIPYFKPAILGAMRGFEVLTNPKIAPRAWRYILNLAAFQGLLKGKMTDEETIKKYEAINNEIIGKSFTLIGDDGRPYTFPIAQELAPLVNMLGLTTEKVYRASSKQDRDDINKELKRGALDLAENLIPTANIAFGSGNLIPQPVKVFVEQKINKDTYTGVPIESEAQLKKLPHLRYTHNTSPTLVKIADILAKKGIEVSPLRMQHSLKSIGSNTAKEALALTDAIGEKMLWTKLRPKSDISDNPVLRRAIPSLYAPYGQLAVDAREIVALTKPAYDYIEKNGDAGLSEKQAAEYNKNANIYSAIEPYWADVQETIKDRNEALKEIEEAGDDIMERYNNKEISKQDALFEQDQVLKIYSDLLDFYNQQELEQMWNIVKTVNEIEKENKKNPR